VQIAAGVSLQTARAISPRFSNPSLVLPITSLIAGNSNGEYRKTLTRSLETGENRRVHGNLRTGIC
jgi:hypothetical protein